MELESLFQDIVESFAIPNDRIAVAISGGIDSITLLHLMINWTKKRFYPTPIALTVNHALRPESENEAEFAVSYAKELGVKSSFILNWKKQNIKSNIQSQARNARYSLLTKWCKDNDVKHLFVAHHKDDQAETFLLRLERGSGVDGLSSMDDKSLLNGVYIIRPLLSFSRSKIEKYANFYLLKWIEDKSNQDLKYRRTLYRNLLRVSNNQEILTERICLAALHIKRAARALMHYTRLAFNDCVNIHDLGYIEIKLSEFYKLPEEIALRLLLYSMMAISSKYYKPRFNNFIKIFKRISEINNDFHCTFSECKIKKYKESILIMREVSKIHELSVNLPLNYPVKWDNRFNCTILWNQKCSITISPLKTVYKIPTFLKNYNCCSEVFYSLPVVLKDRKLLAYFHINYNEENIHSDKFQFITNSIVKQNLVELINI
ncbi:MAG: tRNA lysidine(34) synthetase TilS [Wolbachia endosymbiont of Meromenopon meropis]|nr:tRNA lysidine(34) synthetase TilS [Wolbachia endosymbiont of Meromenopon meropis]